MAELGNLTARIFLPSGGMSTVKIRMGSLFCTYLARIGAWGAAFHPHTGANARTPWEYREFQAASYMVTRSVGSVFLVPPQTRVLLHRMYTDSRALGLARGWRSGAKSIWVQNKFSKTDSFEFGKGPGD